MGQQLSFFFRVSTSSWALSPRQKHHGRKFSYMRKSSTGASHFDHHHHNNNNNNNHDSHNDSGFLLPHELAFHILEYLDMRTKFMIQQVNKSQWYHIVSYWLSLQEAFVFERIDCTTNNNNNNNNHHSHHHHHSDHASSSSTTNHQNHASSNNNNTHQQRKTKQPHFTRISDSSFRQFVIMLDKSFNEYKQQYQIINLTEEKQSSSSSSNINNNNNNNNNNNHDHHDQFVQCGLYGDYYGDYYDDYNDDDHNECDEIDEYHEEENDDVNNVNNIRGDDDDDDEVSEGDVAYNILYEKSESGHSCEHIQLGVESSCQCSNRSNSSSGDHDEKQVRNSTIRSLTMRRKSAIQNGTDCARVNDHDDDFVRTVNNNNKVQNEMTLVATHEMTDCAVKNGKNNVVPHLKSPLPRTSMTTRKQTAKEAVVHVEKKRSQQKQQKPRFKFASLKRVSLIQCQNLQNKSTLSSQFYLPMLKEWNNSTNNNNSGDASLQENHHCYHVGRSAVSVEFKTASSDVIGQKPDVKQRFSFGLAAHSNIGKRKVRNLSRYGNYVHYHYSPQWDTGTTTCSAYVNHAGSTLGPIETSTLCYDYDTRYCSTIFVDDTCYRVFVDSEYKNDTSVNESVEESKSLNNESEDGEDERMQKRLSSSSLIIPSSSWLLQNQTPYEIVRHREKEFPFRHTTDSNALCNVLDQLNVVHNKDVIELRYVSFHHIPSWVGKFRMFSEHSFSVQHRPEITCIVDRNRLFGIQDL